VAIHSVVHFKTNRNL